MESSWLMRVQAYHNPLHQQSIVLSASELQHKTVLTTKHLGPFSIEARLHRAPGAHPSMRLPLVQGMGFITARYADCTPLIRTGMRFARIEPDVTSLQVAKYRMVLEDGHTWLAYVIPADPNAYDAGNFGRRDGFTFVGPAGFTGLIQVAKNPLGDEGEAVYDGCAGTYAAEGKVTATVDGACARDGTRTWD